MPFNIACGRCRNCKEGKTGICLNVNPARPGAAYGYVDMGGWVGGQAEYVMVPYADFNLLKFPDRDQAMAKIRDLTMLSDIFPTGYHGAFTAGVTTGSTVYVAGAGPVGLACRVLGATARRGGRHRRRHERRAARAGASFGCETVDLSQGRLARPSRSSRSSASPRSTRPSTASASRRAGHGAGAGEAPATVLNDIMTIARAGAGIGIPGLYVTGDPGGIDEDAKVGSLKVRLGLGWAKSHSFITGQCPVMRYNRGLMKAILHDKAHIAKAVNATVISLDEAPRRLPGLRQGRRAEVRHRSARHDTGLTGRRRPTPARARSGRGRASGAVGVRRQSLSGCSTAGRGRAARRAPIRPSWVSR